MKPLISAILAICLLLTRPVATSCRGPQGHIHTFGEWVIVTPPTCQSQGLRRQTCSCGEIREEALPQIEHSYRYGVCTDCSTVDVTSDYLTLKTLFTQKYKKNFMAVWNDLNISSVEEFDDYAIIVPFSSTKLKEIEEAYQVELTALRSLQIFNFNLALEFSSAEERDSLLETNGYRLYQKIGSNLAVNKAFFIDSYKRQNDGFFSENGSLLLRATPPADFTIPASVTAIGDYAFSGCANLNSVNIGNSITYIGDHAFYSCNNLDSVTIGNTVTYIGDCAFSQGSSLASITVANANPSYRSIDGNLYSKDGSVLIQYAVAKASKSFTIPDSVVIIRDGAFYGCHNLTSVVIPDFVFFIGDFAFYDCSKLTSVAIPDSITYIGNSAFYNCRKLSSIFIPDSVTFIGDFAFYGCRELTSVVIPDSVTLIGNQAFSYCSNLASITVSGGNSSYQSIDGNLYSKDGSILIQYAIRKPSESFTIPDSVTFIGDTAFSYCSSLASIIIPDSVISIGDNAFYCCSSLASIIIPDSVTFIGSWAFSYCVSLASIIIPDSVTFIGSWAFSNDNLTIYAEAETQPDGWLNDWNMGSLPVVWGYSGSLDNSTAQKNN